MDRLISAAQVFTRLTTICQHRAPEHESQLRPLIGLTPDQAQVAWEHCVEKAGNRKITARLVKNAVEQLELGDTPDSAVTRPSRPNKTQQRKLIDDAIGELLHGLATLDATTSQWLYIATAENPEEDDWSIAATAVRTGPA